MSWFTPTRRKYVYRITTAALALLGVYGIVDGQQIAAWAVLAAAVTGLADANTPAHGE